MHRRKNFWWWWAKLCFSCSRLWVQFRHSSAAFVAWISARFLSYKEINHLLHWFSKLCGFYLLEDLELNDEGDKETRCGDALKASRWGKRLRRLETLGVLGADVEPGVRRFVGLSPIFSIFTTFTCQWWFRARGKIPKQEWASSKGSSWLDPTNSGEKHCSKQTKAFQSLL